GFSSPYSKLSTWLQSLNRFEQLKPVRIVPSHGPIGDASMIARWKTLMTTVQARAIELKKQGRTVDDTVKVIQDELQDRYPRNGLAGVVRAAYNEAPAPPKTVSMDTELAIGFVWFLAFLFSTTVHEAMHALVAWKGGDPTAYHGGQGSLSPIPHITREPIGRVVVPLRTSLTQGWAVG